MKAEKWDRVVTVCLSAEDHEKLKAIAKKSGQSVSSLIRGAVKEWLKKVEGGEKKDGKN